MAITNGSNTTQVVYGTDLVLLVEDPLVAGNWQPIAHATTHSIEITRDAREVSSKSTGEWKNSDYGKISWSGSADALVSFDANIINYATLVQKQIASTKIKIISVLNNTAVSTPLDDENDAYLIDDDQFVLASPTYSGEAIITSVSLNAGEGENATFSLSFTGASPLTKGTVAAAV
jgi:TP901-1 family phage major tail protein